MLVTEHALWLLLAALALDALIGDPDWLWRRLPHPVVGFGHLISAMDRTWNRETMSDGKRRVAGVAVVLVLLAVALLIGFAAHAIATVHTVGDLLIILIAAVLLAQRSLDEHVRRVATAFSQGGLTAARQAVAMVVGRNPETLDQAGVCRAAIETTAENFSDGVAAPAFWFAVAGLPGLIAYKAINTADSMIGHKSPRYMAFGWASARLDDGLNLIPARLSGLAFALAAPLVGGATATALTIMWRDAPRHRSPNAGWPEAATAGALGLALAGPRIYAEGRVDDPYINAGACTDAAPADIFRALRLLWGAWGALVATVLTVAIVSVVM